MDPSIKVSDDANPLATTQSVTLPSTSNVAEGRIKIERSLLNRAIQGDEESLSTMFYQFLPSSELIVKVDYYGFFGFWFVGFYSFACLTDKRLSTLRVGPFKKIRYRDAFYENMTSGGVEQPSLFWLYIFLLIGAAIGIAFIIATVSFLPLIETILPENILFSTAFSSSQPFLPIVFGVILCLGMLPFFLNFLISIFYAYNPSGFYCWIRERLPLVVLVNRRKMSKGNQLYRVWSELKEQRGKAFKKHKKSIN